MAANGRKKLIPELYYEEIYDLFASGVPISTIHIQITTKYNFSCGQKAFYTLIDELKIEKRKHLKEVIDADTDDTIGRLRWLENQLMEIAVESRISDKSSFFKASDRLIKIFELRLSINDNKSNQVNGADYGKEVFQKEIKQLIESAKSVTKDDKNKE